MSIFCSLLREILPTNTIVALLKATNNDKLRPLECAVNNGALALAKAYLLTPGMYIIREEDKGLATYQWIDVTEYEDFGDSNRREWSPLKCLTLLDKNRLNNPHTAQLFSDPLIMRWIKCKILCGVLPAFCCLLMRCILIGLYVVIDSDVGTLEEINSFNNNSTNNSICTDFTSLCLTPTSRYITCIILLVQVTFSLGLEILEYIQCRPRQLCLFYTIDKKSKNIFLQHHIYRMTHLGATIMICLRALTTLVFNNDPRNDFISYSRIFTRTSFWWLIVYFLQLIPGPDFFVVSIQSMFGILGQFCLVYSLFLLAYTQLFMITININSKNGCIAQFGDIFTAMYSTFLAMINMLDFTQFDIINPFPLYLIQVIYVLFVGILLLNFLIAIMTDRIKMTSKYRNIILPMQKLSVVLTTENQHALMGRYYYKWIQRKVFTFYNGRLCIVRILINHNKEMNPVTF